MIVNQIIANIEKAKKGLEDMLDAIPIALYMHDEGFRMIRANRAYAKMAGMPFKDMIDKPYFEVFPKMKKPFKKCEEAIEFQKEEEVEEEEIFIADINKIYRIHFHPFWDELKGYRCSLHILEDITEARQAEEKIKREAETNRALLSVAESLSTTFDREEIFRRVMKILPSVLAADRFVLLLWDNELKAYIPVHSHGMPEDLMPLFMRMQVTKEIPIIEKLQSGEMVIIEDARESPLFPKDIADAYGMKSIMYIPIIRRGNAIGIIGVDRIKVETPFGDKEKTILKGIVYQIVSALENASLYREALEKTMDLNRRIETISAMHSIDREILSTLESQEILENTVKIIGRIISCDRASVTLVDKEMEGFIYKSGFGIPLQKGSIVPFETTTKSEIVNTKRPEFIPDLSLIERIPLHEEFLLKEEFLSHIRVPVIAKDEVIAVLTVGSKRRSAFTADDLSTLEKIAAQIGVALENARLVSDLRELFIGTIKCLSEIIDAKSPWTKGHSERVTECAVKIGKEMGLKDKDLEDLKIAGLLHDIGKIGTYDSILDKPGKLTDEEYEVVKKHSVIGSELLSPIKQLSHIIPCIRAHHERFDGKGYPDGLRGEEIPLQARILLVADTFDSMTADRPYRNTPGREKMLGEIKSCKGTQFDPKVVEAFLKILEDEGKTEHGS
jgi:putative nucleotidyltransferase with HDIG domain/PAS domain S-box-containing protein